MSNFHLVKLPVIYHKQYDQSLCYGLPNHIRWHGKRCILSLLYVRGLRCALWSAALDLTTVLKQKDEEFKRGS